MTLGASELLIFEFGVQVLWFEALETREVVHADAAATSSPVANDYVLGILTESAMLGDVRLIVIGGSW